MFDGRWKFFAFQTWLVYVQGHQSMCSSWVPHSEIRFNHQGRGLNTELYENVQESQHQDLPFYFHQAGISSMQVCWGSGQLDRLTMAELHCNCVLRVWPCIWICECGSQWKARFICRHVKKYTRLQGYEICVYNGKWWPAMELNPVLPWSFRISYASQCQNATVSPGGRVSNSSEKRVLGKFSICFSNGLFRDHLLQASQAAGKIGKDRWQTVWGGQRAMLEPR